MKHHPLADVLPLIEGEGFNELVRTIRENGLRQPITVLDGMILDGRNRYRACLETGVEPKFVEFQGSDPIAFCKDVNFNRRHLNTAQRAMAVAEYATLGRGQRRRAKMNGHGSNPDRSNDRFDLETKRGASTKELSRLYGLPEITLTRAKLVLSRGTKEEIDAVKNDQSTLWSISKQVRERSNHAVTNEPPVEVLVPKRKSRRYGGKRMVVREGLKPSDLARRGLELEKGGLNSEGAAKEIDLSPQAYRQIRDIVLLADRSDLGKTDAKAAQEALNQLDETRQPGTSHLLIKELAKRVFGGKGINRLGRYAANLTKNFIGSVVIISDSCETLRDTSIPHLNDEEADEAVKTLRQAQKDIEVVRQKIQETRR